MISFILCLLTLVVGYFTYGKFIEKTFGPDNRPTPVQQHADGVDYIRMPRWKIFMIQFLNIAGLGPIFGAILGAKFGASCFLWIVLGSIFAGAMHDYLAAMISLRHNGESLPEIVGHYLGATTKQVMRTFSVVLLVLVGAVFVSSPAALLHNLLPEALSLQWWGIIIFVYYLLAAVLPIDKIIGRIYPLFAGALLFMAAGLLIALLVHHPVLPEFWDGLGNAHPQAESLPIFPILFVSVACGAISGFHATQSPMMCRCMQHEKMGRPIFYGAMIVEGIVALIWAAVATYFFHYEGGANGLPTDAYGVAEPVIVQHMAVKWLGIVGGALAVLGVIAAPITTGDTALRSARLIVADMLHINQEKLGKRLAVSAVLFAATMGIILYSQSDKEGFGVIWRYFSWANQTLSVFTLWMITVYLVRHRKCFYISLLPALCMSWGSTTFICIAKECIGMPPTISHLVGILSVVISLLWFVRWKSKNVSPNTPDALP